MIEQHIIRDLTTKCVDDTQRALRRAMQLLDDPGLRAAVMVQTMQALAIPNAIAIGAALGQTATPTRPELLHGMLLVARSISVDGTIRNLANDAQRDASLLIANGFPIKEPSR